MADPRNPRKQTEAADTTVTQKPYEAEIAPGMLKVQLLKPVKDFGGKNEILHMTRAEYEQAIKHDKLTESRDTDGKRVAANHRVLGTVPGDSRVQGPRDRGTEGQGAE